MTIKDRILIFLAKKNIKKETFYAAINMSASNFKGQALQSDLGVEKLARLLNLYPELSSADNMTWLITGRGSLILENEKDQQTADLNNFEQLGDVLASLFAQGNINSNHLNFITTQFDKIFSKLNELEKKTDTVIKYLPVGDNK